MSNRSCMSLSLDLDNKWSYLKTHGDPGWETYPSYLDVVVPRVLEFLSKRALTITFFVVGRDAEDESNHPALQQIVAAGHEIASHSFHHDPWLHLYDEARLDVELCRAETAILAATGVTVTGFRGPGFSLSTGTLEVLQRRGYRYDATAFPNLLNPLARAYFFSRSRLSREQKQERSALFGSFSDAFRPVTPYRWQLSGGELLELPVTTMPGLKLPIHFSYLVYLATYSRRIAQAYLCSAIALCKASGTEPSLLLHPLDFLGADDDADLHFFPAMQLSADTKLSIMSALFDRLLNSFEPITMGAHVQSIEARELLPSFAPRFGHTQPRLSESR